jgi:hypothetical protein
MLYQLFTQDVNRPEITRILGHYFPAFTLIPASGQYNHIPEPALVAEIETDDGAKVYQAAEQIRETNKQINVLVEAIPSTAQMVTSDQRRFIHRAQMMREHDYCN